MRRSVAVIICAFAIVAARDTALAQSPYLGFKAGPSFSRLDFSNNNEGNSWLSSFAGSGFMRFDFAGFSLQPEIMLVNKGSKLDDPFSDAEIIIQYIEFPIGLVFPLGQDRFAPYIMIGPSFAFESQCAVETELFEERGFNCDDDVGRNLEHKEYDFGLFGSAGMTIGWGPGRIVVEGRYTHGLVNLRKDDTPDTVDVSVKNRSFVFFGGYSIGIGRR